MAYETEATETPGKEVEAPETKKKPADNFMSDMRARYQAAWEKDRHNQDAAYDDLRFLAEEGQWEQKARQERETEGRPILIVNKCPQFVRQVTGDIRQMRPAVRVVPVDNDADKDVAVKILPGMVRYIEQRSDAKAAYFSAADQMVAAGIGHCRVYTEYAAETTFNQEICIDPIVDGVAVTWDPDSIHPTRRDAMFCFVPFDYSKETFKKKWPDASPDPLQDTNDQAFTSWFSGDMVRVSEYWCKEPTKRTIAQFETGEILDLTEDEDGSKAADAKAANARIEKRDSFKILRYLVTASEVLEGPDEWPGAHIPIVPFVGEEIRIGRKIDRRGVIRTLKDVQRLYNYAVSAQAEVTALQPKAPFIGTRKNFEKYQDQWETANSRNWSYLEYEPDGTNGGKEPSRVQPPVASQGIQELLQVATQDMSAVTGIYPSSLGQASNESSGKAILARQREGDTGTYVYIEAFGRAVQRVGEIVVDLIPHIYDTERTIHIVGEDGKIDEMKVNQRQLDPNGDGIATLVLNDLTIGTYEVSVEMGPSFSTKREEARDGMQQLLQSLGPNVAPMFVDLFVKMQDFPLADKIAKRAQMLLPPQIQQMEAQESGEPMPQMPPQAPPPPTPEQQMQSAQMQQEGQFNQAKLQIEQQKLGVDVQKINADLEIARMNHAQAKMSHEQAMVGHAVTAHEANQETQQAGIAAQQSDAENAQEAAQPQEKQEPASDPRIDALVDAVQRLQAAVIHIAEEVSKGSAPAGPPPGAPPGIGPLGPPAPPPQIAPEQVPGLPPQ